MADPACQRVGALGINNLATSAFLRTTLVDAGALEPLMTLARSDEIDVETQRFSVLAMANLAAEVENHQSMLEEGTLPLLISLSNSPDEHVSVLTPTLAHTHTHI